MDQENVAAEIENELESFENALQQLASELEVAE